MHGPPFCLFCRSYDKWRNRMGNSFDLLRPFWKHLNLFGIEQTVQNSNWFPIPEGLSALPYVRARGGRGRTADALLFLCVMGKCPC